MSEYTFTIKGTPVPKGRPRFARMGSFVQAYTPTKTKKAEKNVSDQVKIRHHGKPLKGPLAVYIKFFFPLPKYMRTKKKLEMFRAGMFYHTAKPDLDNLAKSYTDALNGVLWEDDKAITHLSLSKEYTEEEEGKTIMNVYSGDDNGGQE